MAIADPTAYVAEGSELDKEAAQRAFTVWHAGAQRADDPAHPLRRALPLKGARSATPCVPVCSSPRTACC